MFLANPQTLEMLSKVNKGMTITYEKVTNIAASSRKAFSNTSIKRYNETLMAAGGATQNIIGNMDRIGQASNKAFSSTSTAVGMLGTEMSASLTEATSHIENMNKRTQAVEKMVINLGAAEEKVNDQLEDSVEQAKKLAKELGSAVVLGAEKVMDMSDQFGQNQTKLSFVVDDNNTVEQLRANITQTARESHASFDEIAATMASLDKVDGGVLGGDNGVLAFTEQLYKSAAITGEDPSAAVSAIESAMASGSLDSGGLATLMTDATPIVENIQSYMQAMGVEGADNLEELASKGLITSAVIRDAMLSAADETNERFGQVPATFADVKTMAMDSLIQGIAPLLEAVSALSTTIYDNWSIIEPLFWGLAIAIGAFTIASKLFSAVAAIQGIVTGGLTLATEGFNKALLASPITWIIGIIIAVIAIFYAVIAVINKLTGQSISATGVIAGVIGTVGAFIGNVFMGLLQIVIGVIEYMINKFVAFANFFGNLFNDPIASVIKLFADLADNVLGVLEKIASGMDFIFGSDLAGTIKNWRGDLKVMAETAVKEYGNGSYEEKVSELDINGILDDFGVSMDRFDYGKAYSKGYDVGANFKGQTDDLYNSDQYSDLLKNADIADSEGSVANDSGYGDAASMASQANTMESTTEDMDSLRSVADQSALSRFNMSEIKIEMNNHNKIDSEMDIDGVVTKLEEKLYEAMQNSAEGVYSY